MYMNTLENEHYAMTSLSHHAQSQFELATTTISKLWRYFCDDSTASAWEKLPSFELVSCVPKFFLYTVSFVGKILSKVCMFQLMRSNDITRYRESIC